MFKVLVFLRFTGAGLHMTRGHVSLKKKQTQMFCCYDGRQNIEGGCELRLIISGWVPFERSLLQAGKGLQTQDTF